MGPPPGSRARTWLVKPTTGRRRHEPPAGLWAYNLGPSSAQGLDNVTHALFPGLADVDDDGIVGLLQGVELALEELSRHEMSLAGLQPGLDEREAGFQVDHLHHRRIDDQDIPIGGFQG